MSTVQTTVEWVDERDKPDGELWGLEYGRLLDHLEGDNETVAFERATDKGTWYVDLYVPDRPRTPDEARLLGEAILAAASEAELRN